jgi:hypothetical protein
VVKICYSVDNKLFDGGIPARYNAREHLITIGTTYICRNFQHQNLAFGTRPKSMMVVQYKIAMHRGVVVKYGP